MFAGHTAVSFNGLGVNLTNIIGRKVLNQLFDSLRSRLSFSLQACSTILRIGVLRTLGCSLVFRDMESSPSFTSYTSQNSFDIYMPSSFRECVSIVPAIL